MLTPPWYTTTSAYPSTDYDSIVHQTAGHTSNSNISSSVLNMSINIGDATGKREKYANKNDLVQKCYEQA